MLSKFVVFTTLLGTTLILPTLSVQAQIIPDNSLGNESSVVVPNQNINGINSDRIDGGAIRGSNLFHSFQEFNIDNGSGAYFSNPESIVNILTRVTGSNISNILGTLGVLGNANLFLINPNGIVFGPNARLDVGGSFFASTADSILFENGVEFAASNPDAPPLLTINIPIGLNFRENPGNIVNQSIAVDSEDNLVGLQVLPRRTLGLVGGEVRFEGGAISSPGSRIELGGLSEPGIIEFNPDGSLSFPTNVQRADVLLTNGAFTGVIGNPGGSVAINARNLEVSGDSLVINGASNISNRFDSEVEENTETGILQAGDITINATESVILIGQDSAIGNIVSPEAVGNAGNINVQTNFLSVTNGAQINGSTLGNGNGGDITINATDVELIGDSSNLNTSAFSGSTGNGGTIAINTQNLRLQDGAGIISSTFSNGNGGDITINGTDVELVGNGSGFFAIVQPEASGTGGNISIDTQRLQVAEGARVIASTFGNGNAGDINIKATDIELIGTFTNNGQISTEIATPTQVTSSQNGGDLTIDTQRLIVRDGAQITSGTSGAGNAGNLTIQADSIEVIGRSIDRRPSAVATSAEQLANTPTVTGNGGTLTIDTRLLSVQDGGSISAGTGGEGDAGNLIIRASEVVEVNGVSIDGQASSSVSTSTRSGSTGGGGTLTIDTRLLSIQDGGSISAGTGGEGDGGNLVIKANTVEVTGIDPIDSSSSSTLSARTQGAGIGGDLTIETQTLVVADEAQVDAVTFGSGDGGNINITATDIRLSNGSILGAAVQPGAIGNGGNVIINAQRLDILDSAEISSGTFGGGDSGNLAITATDIQLVGDDGGLFALVGPGATGQGGTITIDTQRLQVRDQAEIAASTVGNADAGDITINANEVEIIDTGSLIFATVAPGAIGNGGDLTINTQSLSVRDGAQISAGTSGNGNAGNLTVTATEVELVNSSTDGVFSTIIDNSVQPGAIGTGGDLTIDTQRLLVRDGAQIGTATFGNGDAGDLIVTANDVELIDAGSLAASVEPGATGNGRILSINTQNLRVRDGAFVSAATRGNGDGGDLIVTATNVELVGALTGLAASATSTSTGQGGILMISAENLTVRDEAIIDVRSEGTEAAGNLIINAPNILLDNQASLNGETTAGQGNIFLNTSDIRLRNNSNITTNATGVATGGNITINTETLTAIENSDISANAEDAFGGRVTINATGVFGTAFRTQQSQFSDITATSELGPEFSGTVELNTELDPSSGLIDLTQTVTDPNDLIAAEFCRQRGSSAFVVRGRGGIAISPNDKSDGNQINVDLVEPVPSQPQNTSQKPSEINNNQSISSLDIIPARGWIRDENGDVILVSYDPTKTGINRQQQQLPQCQSE